MSKNKKLLMMAAKGGMSQSEMAAAAHVSKRQASLAVHAVKDYSLTFDSVSSMDADVVDELFFPKNVRTYESACLQPDFDCYIERKKRNRRLPVKLFWLEYCEKAADCDMPAMSYQMFARKFNEQAERSDAVRHFNHEPAAKCYIDWAGDLAWITDRVTGAKTKAYALVVCLPFSGKFWAEFFCDMKQRSWQLGQMHAFEHFGGVPRMLVPDNAATATDRTAIYVTLVNKEYERFAEHYDAAVVPARVRKPRDKSLAEGTVNLVEEWIIGPACEATFYTLEELNAFCAEKVAWLNERPFAAKEGSRDVVFANEEQALLQPLPAQRCEMCEWRSAKVSPDYHVTVDYMHYSVFHTLIGKQVDIKLTDTSVVIMSAGEVVAKHTRLYGRKGQYSTIADHMPKSHRAMESPWSPERFTSWAAGIGPETKAAIERLMASRSIVEQSYVSCRNILGLAKSYAPSLLEEACKKLNETGAMPSYTAAKNTILAIKSARAYTKTQKSAPTQKLVDRAKNAGRTRGADAYRRGGE